MMNTYYHHDKNILDMEALYSIYIIHHNKILEESTFMFYFPPIAYIPQLHRITESIHKKGKYKK